MPHLVLEYTENMGKSTDLTGTLQDLNQAIAEASGTGIGNFKSRAVRREIHVVGTDRGESGFVHLEIAIFGGRSQATKDEIGCLSLAILEKHFWQSIELAESQLTVEIRDIDREAYYKSTL